MANALLANTPISRVSLPSDLVLLFLGVAIAEPIALWFFLKKWSRFNVSFPRLLLYSLIANTASTLLGPFLELLLFPIFMFLFPMGWGGNPFLITAKLPPFYTVLLPFQLIYLAFSFGLSCLIEWFLVYRRIQTYDGSQWQTLGKQLTFKGTLLANLTSYSLLAAYITGIAYLPLHLSPEYQASQSNGGVFTISRINEQQINFHREKQRFARSFSELKNGSQEIYSSDVVSRLKMLSSNRARSKLYEYTLSADANHAIVTAQPFLFDNLKSGSGIIFLSSQNELIRLICRSDTPSKRPPLLQPQGDNLSCPTGSSALKPSLLPPFDSRLEMYEIAPEQP